MKQYMLVFNEESIILLQKLMPNLGTLIEVQGRNLEGENYAAIITPLPPLSLPPIAPMEEEQTFDKD